MYNRIFPYLCTHVKKHFHSGIGQRNRWNITFHHVKVYTRLRLHIVSCCNDDCKHTGMPANRVILWIVRPQFSSQFRSKIVSHRRYLWRFHHIQHLHERESSAAPHREFHLLCAIHCRQSLLRIISRIYWLSVDQADINLFHYFFTIENKYALVWMVKLHTHQIIIFIVINSGT